MATLPEAVQNKSKIVLIKAHSKYLSGFQTEVLIERDIQKLQTLSGPLVDQNSSLFTAQDQTKNLTSI